MRAGDGILKCHFNWQRCWLKSAETANFVFQRGILQKPFSGMISGMQIITFCFFIFYFSDYQVKQIMSENLSYWATYRSRRKRVKEHLSAIYCGTESSNLTDELRFWVLQHNISTNPTNAILTILRQHHHNLPKDTHTLLKTKTQWTNGHSNNTLSHIQYILFMDSGQSLYKTVWNI